MGNSPVIGERWSVNSPHKWPVTQKMFPYDDVITWSLCMWSTIHSNLWRLRSDGHFGSASMSLTDKLQAVVLWALKPYFIFIGCYPDQSTQHDDVIKWKHFLRYWPFVRGIHRSPVNSPHKGQWRGVLMFSLICAWINSWVNNREAGDLRRHRAHYDVAVMIYPDSLEWLNSSPNIKLHTPFSS